jgi:hypothetical protein
MSTKSHKSNTRIKSESAMKRRLHTSRKDRDLTVDGLDKHHHESVANKAREKSSRVKIAAGARAAKHPHLRGE